MAIWRLDLFSLSTGMTGIQGCPIYGCVILIFTLFPIYGQTFLFWPILRIKKKYWHGKVNIYRISQLHHFSCKTQQICALIMGIRRQWLHGQNIYFGTRSLCDVINYCDVIVSICAICFCFIHICYRTLTGRYDCEIVWCYFIRVCLINKTNTVIQKKTKNSRVI